VEFTHDLWIKMSEKDFPYPTWPFTYLSPQEKGHFSLFFKGVY
jgi:hypothetical protein